MAKLYDSMKAHSRRIGALAGALYCLAVPMVSQPAHASDAALRPVAVEQTYPGYAQAKKGDSLWKIVDRELSRRGRHAPNSEVYALVDAVASDNGMYTQADFNASFPAEGYPDGNYLAGVEGNPHLISTGTTVDLSAVARACGDGGIENKLGSYDSRDNAAAATRNSGASSTADGSDASRQNGSAGSQGARFPWHIPALAGIGTFAGVLGGSYLISRKTGSGDKPDYKKMASEGRIKEMYSAYYKEKGVGISKQMENCASRLEQIANFAFTNNGKPTGKTGAQIAEHLESLGYTGMTKEKVYRDTARLRKLMKETEVDSRGRLYRLENEIGRRKPIPIRWISALSPSATD